MFQLLSYPDLKNLGIRYSKSHLYHLMSHKKFPRPARLSTNTVAWIRADVENWINEKIKAHKEGVNHE